MNPTVIFFFEKNQHEPSSLEADKQLNAILLLMFVFIHTCIFGNYNPSVSIIDLVSHTTYVVCVNLIHKWQDL